MITWETADLSSVEYAYVMGHLYHFEDGGWVEVAPDKWPSLDCELCKEDENGSQDHMGDTDNDCQ